MFNCCEQHDECSAKKRDWISLGFMVYVFGLVLFAHRSNISRLLHNKESALIYSLNKIRNDIAEHRKEEPVYVRLYCCAHGTPS